MGTTADLHMHGPIGFQDYWLKVQGYAGKNLAEEIYKIARVRGIDIASITSEEFEIPKESVHDRFNYLVREAEKLGSEYSCGKMGDKDIAFVIEGPDRGRLIILNGQTVIINEKGKRLDTLVVGSNQIPNQRGLRETLDCIQDLGLISIAEHPICETHCGIGISALSDNLDRYDGIEGHNAQMCLPRAFAKIPVVGQYTKVTNDLAQKFAKAHKDKPWTASSDAHRIEDLGIAYVEFCDTGEINGARTEEGLLENIKRFIQQGRFQNEESYESILGWLNWVSKFKSGLIFNSDKI